MSGSDFWRNQGTIRHDRFVADPAVRDGRLEFATESTLVGRENRELARQVSRFTIRPRPQAHLLVWEATFAPLIDGFYFGDQEEMGLGARVATPVTEQKGGVLTSSTGDRTAKTTWGKGYDWCDYSGELEGRRAGIAIFPDPQNFRGSWWHNRDYGVFVANPFGRAAMRQGAISRVEVKKGETLRLRFGILLHSSLPADKFDLPAAYRSFLETLAPRNP